VVGSANMDLVVRAAVLPAPGQTVIGEDLVRVPGGKGANQAVAAARLGAPTNFVGCVGVDAFGDELRHALAASSVDVRYLRRVDDRPSGVALIVVDARGENLIAVSSGANAALSVAHVSEALRDLAPTGVLLTQLESPLETVAAACQIARRVGAHVVLNAAPADSSARALLSQVDTLIVNAGEATRLSNRPDPNAAAADLRAAGPAVVVVTLGADGLIAAVGQDLLRVPARAVSVVDTTAAGDAFAGAYAVALLERRDAAAALAFATVAAGLATTRPGAQSSLPSRAEVDSVLRQGGS
jgi:ribokinase